MWNKLEDIEPDYTDPDNDAWLFIFLEDMVYMIRQRIYPPFAYVFILPSVGRESARYNIWRYYTMFFNIKICFYQITI